MGINDLLAGGAAAGKKKVEADEQGALNYEKISFSAYPEDAEWFRDLKWHLTLNKGITRYKDVFAEMISALKKKYPSVTPRPEHVRQIEREQGRARKS